MTQLDTLYSQLTLPTTAKLALIVMDGVGDIATKDTEFLTPLEAAATPNMDQLSHEAIQGRMTPVAPGITPGSGPGHLALFGYDPVETQVGRGVIEALPVDELKRWLPDQHSSMTQGWSPTVELGGLKPRCVSACATFWLPKSKGWGLLR